MNYFLLSLTVAGLALAQATGAPSEQQGNWTVGTCIMAAMDIDITVPTDKLDLNKTITISVNPANKNVTAGGSCGPTQNGTKQELSLWWEDIDHENKTNLLDRNLTLTITKDQKKGTYGVTHISGTIEVRIVNKTNSTFVNFDGDFPTALLITPVNMSYTCETEQSVSLNGTWKHGIHPPPHTTTTTTTTTTKKTTTTTKKTTTTTTKKTTTTTTKKTTTTTTKKTTTTTTKKTTTTTTKKTTTTTTTKSTTTTKKTSTTTTTKSTTTTTKSTTSSTTSKTSTILPKELDAKKNTTTTTTKSTSTTTKKTTTTAAPHYHTDQFKTSVKFSKIQLDAFRSKNTSNNAFQAATDCQTNGKGSNDLIPIIVGCVLAAMVVIVLVAYLIGRRYQANNYERMED